MNNKICNPKTEITKGMKYNDKDCISKLNASLKELGRNCMTALSESSNDNLHCFYKDSLDKIVKYQREAFLLMFKKGWYCLEKSDNTNILDKYSTLKQQYDDLYI